MFAPSSVQSPEPLTLPDGRLQFIEHDWLIGAALIAYWSFGFFFAAFAEKFEPPSAGFGWMIVMSPVAVLGVWKITERRVYRFAPREKKVEIDGFSLLRGRWQLALGYDVAKFVLERRWVAGRNGGLFWFVMLRGPGVGVALDRRRTEEEAAQRLAEYVASCEKPNQ